MTVSPLGIASEEDMTIIPADIHALMEAEHERRLALVIGVNAAPDAQDPRLHAVLKAEDDAVAMAEVLHAHLIVLISSQQQLISLSASGILPILSTLLCSETIPAL